MRTKCQKFYFVDIFFSKYVATEPSMRLSNPTYSRGHSGTNLINDLFSGGPYIVEDNLRYDFKKCYERKIIFFYH